MYKVDDVVVCLPGFNDEVSWANSKTGGAGYKENKVFRIKEISSDSGHSIIWPEEDRGVYSQAVRKATIQEIEKYVKDNKCDIEEILEICKNLYPIGTNYNCLHQADKEPSDGIFEAFDDCIRTNYGGKCCYSKGKFAQIVSQQEELPFKVGDRFQYKGKSTIYTIETITENKCKLSWLDGETKKDSDSYTKKELIAYFNNKTWIIIEPQLKKEDFYNTKIDVSESEELSRLVQEKLFELGFMWCGGANPYKVDTSHKTETILFIDKDNTFFRRRKSDLKSGYRDIYPQDLGINTNNNNLTNNNNVTKENNNSSISKIQGFNQQITSSSGARGIGLTSSRSKITLGTVNKPNKVGLSTRK